MALAKAAALEVDLALLRCCGFVPVEDIVVWCWVLGGEV